MSPVRDPRHGEWVAVRVAHLLETLERQMATEGLTSRALAERSGVSLRTIKTWRSASPGIPGSRQLALVGLVAGLRLELVPSRDDYPGQHRNQGQTWPAIPTWARGDSGNRARRFDDPVARERVVYLLQLIGAEVRWARSELPLNPEFQVHWSSLVNNQTKILVEAGPRFASQARAASPYAMELLARRYSLGLGWQELSSPWRVRPWLLAGARAAPRLRRAR